nr:hypothetical protein [Tanacetum cinerariifolium]
KSDASDEFAQIIDFLSGSYIHYALTDVIREILRLDDAKGVVCLLNEEIFAGLAQIGYEKPSKFYMYPRFIQLVIQAQVVDLSSYTTRYISPVLTQKVFANMRRVGKGFSGVETPLFENMLEVREVDAEEEVQVPAQDDVDQENVTEETADDVAQPTSPLPPSPVILSLPPHQSPIPPPPQAAEGSSLLVQQVLDKCSALVLRIEELETSNTAQQLEILKLKARVKKLERLNKVKSSKLRRLKKVGTSQRIESLEDEENMFNQGRISVDIDKGIELVLSMQEDTKVQEVVEVVNAAKLMTEVVTAVATTAASIPIPAAKPAVAVSTRKRKGVVIRDPEEELHNDTPAETLSAKDKGKEMEKEDEEIIKSINETPAQKAAKRRRLREQAKEDENLKKQLEVVVDEDDDVLIEATPIGRKVPVVNYEIVMINNKPRFTLEQLVNVARLQVKKESEMSLELLKFTRQQLLEYQQE